MTGNNRLFDDFARAASGAAGAFAGLRAEVEGFVRQQMDRLLADMDLVTRDEFEAVKAMAAKARLEQETLEKRLAALEGKAAPKKRAARKAPAKKPAAGKPAAAKPAAAKKDS